MTSPDRLSLDDLARAADIPARQLRELVRLGILPPPSSRGRGAFYDEAHLLRARAWRRLRDGAPPGTTNDQLRVLVEKLAAADMLRPVADGTVPIALVDDGSPDVTIDASCLPARGRRGRARNDEALDYLAALRPAAPPPASAPPPMRLWEEPDDDDLDDLATLWPSADASQDADDADADATDESSTSSPPPKRPPRAGSPPTQGPPAGRPSAPASPPALRAALSPEGDAPARLVLDPAAAGRGNATELLGRLHEALRDWNARHARQARGRVPVSETWHRVTVGRDVEITARGPLTPDELALLEGVGALLQQAIYT